KPVSGINVSGIWRYEEGHIKPVALVGQANNLFALNPGRGFSVRWTGQVRPTTTEEYTFYTLSRHGTRLWVDGKQVTNKWSNSGVETGGKVQLEAGRKYDVMFEMFHTGEPSTTRLAWSTPTIDKETIPTSALCPADAPEDAAEGTGLSGAYFIYKNHRELAMKRVDPVMQFSWKDEHVFGDDAGFRARLPEGANLFKEQYLFAWSDLNDNGTPEPEELTLRRGKAESVNIQGDFSVVTGTGYHLKPKGFTPGGAPIFDAADF